LPLCRDERGYQVSDRCPVLLVELELIGISSMGQNLATVLAGEGVTVNTVCIGAMMPITDSEDSVMIGTDGADPAGNDRGDEHDPYTKVRVGTLVVSDGSCIDIDEYQLQHMDQ
jgi:hypothetical protein